MRLGVDYVDLIQCHDIEFADHDQLVDETLPTLQRLKEQGLVRHIGITGLHSRFSQHPRPRRARVVETILSFCHYELNDTSLAELLPYLQGKGIGIINASPTGMGLLTPQGVPAWHPADEALKEGCRKAVAHCQAAGRISSNSRSLLLRPSGIATTLVGTARPQNIRANIAYVNEPIDETAPQRSPGDSGTGPQFQLHTRGLPEHRDPVLTKETATVP